MRPKGKSDMIKARRKVKSAKTQRAAKGFLGGKCEITQGREAKRDCQGLMRGITFKAVKKSGKPCLKKLKSI